MGRNICELSFETGIAPDRLADMDEVWLLTMFAVQRARVKRQQHARKR